LAKSPEALILITLFIGALFFLAGLVFTLQGLGIVGPTSSFMFRSQSWIDNGIGILVLGVILLGIAFYFRTRSKSIAKVPPGQLSP
jgi:hypothetical protein